MKIESEIKEKLAELLSELDECNEALLDSKTEADKAIDAAIVRTKNRLQVKIAVLRWVLQINDEI